MIAANRRQIAVIAVGKRLERLTFQARLDALGDMFALLLGDRRHTGQHSSRGIGAGRRVTDDKHIVPVRHQQIGANDHPPRPVTRNIEPLRGARCLHPGGPDRGASWDEFLADRHAHFIDGLNLLAEPDFHAQLLDRQLSLGRQALWEAGQ